MPKNRLPFVAISAIIAAFSSTATAQTVPMATEAVIQPAVEPAPAPLPDAAAEQPDAPAPVAAPQPVLQTPPGPAAPPPFQPAAFVAPAWQATPLAGPLPSQQALGANPAPRTEPDRSAGAEDRDADRYQGVYVKVDFGSQFAATSSAGVGAQQGCTTCDAGLGAGGELGLRIGYSFGWLALEAHGFGGYDNSRGTIGQSDAGAGAGDYAFHRVGGGGAIGARVTYPDRLVRPTLGIGVGVARRAMTFVYEGAPSSATSTAPQSDVGDFVGYTAPRLQADAGVMLGRTPGVKIELGIAASVEMAGDHTSSGQVAAAVQAESGAASNAGEVTLVRGPQVMIGPALSLQFGR